MKRFSSLLMILAFVLFFGVVVQAEERRISVDVDGVAVEFPDGVMGRIVEGKTLVPLRGVFEALGFEVTWDSSTRRAAMHRDNDMLMVSEKDALITLNGQRLHSEVPPQTIEGRLMLPLRVIAEATGAEVVWDGANNKVHVKSKLKLDVPEDMLPPTSEYDVIPVSHRFVEILKEDYTIKYDLYLGDSGDLGTHTQAVTNSIVATLSEVSGAKIRTIVDEYYTIIMLNEGRYTVQTYPPDVETGIDFLYTLSVAHFVNTIVESEFIVDVYSDGWAELRVYVLNDRLDRIEFSVEVEDALVVGYMKIHELYSGVDTEMFEIPIGFQLTR